MLMTCVTPIERGADRECKVQVDLSRLYKGIDLPETLSNLTGKRIRRILPVLTPMGVGVDSDPDSMAEPAECSDSGGACTPPAIHVSMNSLTQKLAHTRQGGLA